MKLPGLIVLIALAIAFQSFGQCAKIGLLPIFGKSHVHILNKMAQGLIERGHDVRIIVEKTQVLPNMKTPAIFYDVKKPFVFGPVRDNISVFTSIVDMIEVQRDYCASVLNNSDVMSYLNTVDLFITDRLYFCGSLIGIAIGKPIIILSPGGMNMPRGMLSNPFPLSYVPHGLTGYSAKMSFKQRFMNAITFCIGNIFFSYLMSQCAGTINHQFNIATSKSMYEIENSPSMVLITGDFVLEYPRPLLPNVKIIGAISCQPAVPLPSDLEAFMSGERKVVYIAFGSIFEDFSEKKMKIFVDAVNRLPYKVLWKSKAVISNLGSHVKMISWAPQNDILGHKNTIAFFSHCGHNSMYEAAYHAVPVLGMPIHGDQFDNMQQILRAKFGFQIAFNDLTSDDIVHGIAEVVADKYRENAKRVSVALRSPRTSSQDMAVDWAEYVIANKGAKHLRMEGYNLSFIEYYMLDVLLAFILIVITVIYVIKRFFQFIYFRCCKVKTD